MEAENASGMDKLAAALAKAQASMGTAKKTKTNPFFKSHYADLADVWAVIREPLSANGLAVSQMLEFGESGAAKLVTLLLHTSGQSLRALFPVKPVKDDAQGWGSAMTYARRYGLAALVGVAVEDEDDDGNNAAGQAVVGGGQPTARPAPVATAGTTGMAATTERKAPVPVAAKGQTGVATDLQASALRTLAKVKAVDLAGMKAERDIIEPMTAAQAAALISELSAMPTPTVA